MQKVYTPYFDPDFDSLSERIYGPPCRVSIDNQILEDCTVVKTDSVNKQEVLLEVVKVLTDMNLTIFKGYISSDAAWCMNVFHVKDEHGSKITDQRFINYIQQAIDTNRVTNPKSSPEMGMLFQPDSPNKDPTAIVTGWTQLLPKIMAARTNNHHHRHSQITTMDRQLATVLQSTSPRNTTGQGVKAAGGSEREERETRVTVESCDEREYSIVNVRCKDRRRLMFDTVCTLMDMQYIIFHASVDTQGDYAFQEYFIRHKDGCMLNTNIEKDRLIKCIKAAIERSIYEVIKILNNN